jgi:hypothetical protein
MQIYWSLKSIPELSGLPRAERGRRWRAAYRKTFRHWQTWVSLLALGLCSVLGEYLGSLTGSQFIGSVVGAGVGGLIYGQVATELARPYLRSLSSVQHSGGEPGR